MFCLTGGLYLGWALGANNAANCFGTAVASRIITFRKACILCGISVLIGAVLQGQAGIDTLSGLTKQNITALVIISTASAATVTLMTVFALPTSASQAVIGAIIGAAMVTGDADFSGLKKVFICWIGTPIGAMLMAMIAYKLLDLFLHYVPMSMLTRDKILWAGLLIVGIYASYALGANNVANATGIFSGQIEGLSDRNLALLGGIAIAAGVLTFSKRVMMAVGSGILTLDAFSALVAVGAMAATTHVFAFVGVPISTSQGIVGAIIGIAVMRGMRSIKVRFLRNIAFGWLLTPTIALILSAAAYGIITGGLKTNP
ncbi:MAG: inorganic phosphate transporter [Planctomycetota bacterium]